jgi:hypothetical protein
MLPSEALFGFNINNKRTDVYGKTTPAGHHEALLSVFAQAQPHTVAGEITTPYPTLMNVSLEWFIEGDDNQNGVVEVHYRKKGSANRWQKGMPLRRVPAGENIRFTWANKHSGSVFDLTPDTLYEIRLTGEYYNVMYNGHL